MKTQPFIISEDEIQRNLPGILENTIVLDGEFRIIMVSSDVLVLLQYGLEDICGRSANILCEDINLVQTIQPMLESGFFKNKKFELYTRFGKSIPVWISGFYIGAVITPGNGVVLKLSFK